MTRAAFVTLAVVAALFLACAEWAAKRLVLWVVTLLTLAS